MRITKNQLRQIIKEELSGVLREQQSPEELSASAASLSLDDLLAIKINPNPPQKSRPQRSTNPAAAKFAKLAGSKK